MIYDVSLYDDIVVTDPVKAAIYELDVLFSTSPTELIGNVNYGVNFLQFLWQLTPSTDNVRRYILDKINANTYYARSLRHDVEVTTKENTAEKVYIVQISIYNPKTNEPVKKIYNIHK